MSTKIIIIYFLRNLVIVFMYFYKKYFKLSKNIDIIFQICHKNITFRRLCTIFCLPNFLLSLWNYHDCSATSRFQVMIVQKKKITHILFLKNKIQFSLSNTVHFVFYNLILTEIIFFQYDIATYKSFDSIAIPQQY